MKATLALADGTVFEGRQFGAEGKVGGEVVFNTSMTGYQEILTDPSYEGQIVTMTYPEIGNVGVNTEDVESARPYVRGFVVREYWDAPSNWRAEERLAEYMRAHGIVGIEDIDTRKLVRVIRERGAQQAVLATGEVDAGELVREAAARPSLEGMDLATRVTCRQPYRWTLGSWSLGQGYRQVEPAGPLIVAFDFGVKLNILRHFVDLGCRPVVVPATTDAEFVRSLRPDGIFLSNGPGDPGAVRAAIRTVAELAREFPVFGICLGHQILALAFGARTFKLKFGHHGGNHPVIDVDTGVVEITSQNHGFAVDEKSLPPDLRVTRVNLNDHTVEGIERRDGIAFSVQYHPEASPGPHDARSLFARFVERLETRAPAGIEREIPVRTIGLRACGGGGAPA
ncbi:MAG: carbamoyl-phosphate synthase small subunit [Candidatus Dadabacteria bacterium]|nr:MAG: carbamoyl-phosphate synthase small subunit [Candidatus Dadabacteria bacterium]